MSGWPTVAGLGWAIWATPMPWFVCAWAVCISRRFVANIEASRIQKTRLIFGSVFVTALIQHLGSCICSRAESHSNDANILRKFGLVRLGKKWFLLRNLGAGIARFQKGKR